MAQLQPNPAADNALAQSILGAKIVSPAAPLTLNFSLGCVLSEVVIDMYLCGLLSVMLFRYFTTQPDKPDAAWVVALVVAMTLITYAHTGFNIFYVWYLLVSRFGDYAQFFETDKSAWFPLVESLTAFIAQVFFAHRAFRLNGRNWYILLSVWALMLTAVGAATATTIIYFDLSSLLDSHRIFQSNLLWLAASMTTDFIITASILKGLHSSRTGWSHTDTVIRRLTLMTLQSQTLPFLFSLAWMISFCIEYTSLIRAVFFGTQAKLYGLGLLFSLNARAALADGTHLHTSQTLAAIRVDVETETYEMHVPRSRDFRMDKLEDVQWEERSMACSTITGNTRVRVVAPKNSDTNLRSE